ncbi:questin oxidase family protein [uncultured Modestobacter sp.]|uniref:questin oxidase family protein n=1 Tax=uncultured Modestobacter sp. TaxID=380048 RepID=UPI002602FA87|nr:questin oxidase family protein [uncultured Modestobacter sp.]
MSAELDEVYERMRTTGPEFDGWLSNHGPMAADALLRLGAGGRVHAWLDGYADRLEEAPRPRWPIPPDQWREVLGDPSRLGDWLSLFDRELAERPWVDVLVTWWPRLLPGSLASATHGLIRTGHAVRALREEGTAPRRAELAQALGYWAARWLPAPGRTRPDGDRPAAGALDGVPVLAGPGGFRTRLARVGEEPGWAPAVRAAAAPDDVPAGLDALVDAAVQRYGRWTPGSPVMLVHAATAPRAAALVLPSLPRELWAGTYRAAWVTAAAITAAYRSPQPLPDPPAGLSVDELVDRAAGHGDEHVLKFAEVAVEAAGRGVPTAVGSGLRAVALV